MQEAQAPSGQVPQYLVVSEIQRRTDMRKRYQEQQQPQGTVADQIVQEAAGGIASMPPQGMPPQGMPPQGMPPQGAPQQAMPPQAMPPQQMFSGGIIRLQEGGFLDQQTVSGAGDVRSQVERAIAEGASMSDLLAIFRNQPEAIELVKQLVADRQRASLSPVEVTAQRMEPASIGDSLPDQSSEGLASLYRSFSEAGSASLEDAASIRQGAVDFFSGLEDSLTPESVRRARRGLPTGRDPLMFRSAANQQDLGPFQGYYDEMISPKPGQVDAPEALKDALELAQEGTRDESGKGVGALYDEDGIERLLGVSGAKNVQGDSPIQTQALSGNKTEPSLDFADLIAESKKAGMANALMQLGAGIAGGDLSKGISAAGVAATKGQQAAKDMAIKQRLATYAAGREDQAREEKAEQFDRQMKALETRYANELAKSASVGRNELFRTVTSLVEAAMEGSTEFDPVAREAMVQAMMKKYLTAYAPAFDVDPEAVSFGMQEPSGARTPEQIKAIYGV